MIFAIGQQNSPKWKHDALHLVLLRLAHQNSTSEKYRAWLRVRRATDALKRSLGKAGCPSRTLSGQNEPAQPDAEPVNRP